MFKFLVLTATALVGASAFGGTTCVADWQICDNANDVCCHDNGSCTSGIALGADDITALCAFDTGVASGDCMEYACAAEGVGDLVCELCESSDSWSCSDLSGSPVMAADVLDGTYGAGYACLPPSEA